MHPIGLHFLGKGVVPPFSIGVEVAIEEGLGFQSFFHPRFVDAETAQEHASVLSSQPSVKGHDAFGLQFHEYGIDELHDVVAL